MKQLCTIILLSFFILSANQLNAKNNSRYIDPVKKEEKKNTNREINNLASPTAIIGGNKTRDVVINVSFSTNPAAVSGTVTICKGQTVTFTDTSTEVGANPTYLWSFPGGNIISANTSGPHTISYSAAGTFTASLSINGGTAVNVTVVVLDSTASSAEIILVDGNFWGTSTFNGNQYFIYCSNDANTAGGPFSFTTNSTNTTATTQHIFNWGDSQSDTYTGTNLSETFHFYQNSGTYTLTYTIVNSTGCTTIKNYNIYIGASPTATINTGGIPVLCTPGSVTYIIFPGAQNSPNTIYTFQVNDGSPAVVFAHPPPATYTHNFTVTSCGVTSIINSTVFPNSFQASITASNLCGTSSSAFGPINIQSPPDANFTRTPSNASICKGTTVLFTNTTTGGNNIGNAPTYTCTDTYKKYWTIIGPFGNIPVTSGGVLIANVFISATENFGYNNNQPNNSGAWISSASNQLNITFNTAGIYTITLFTGSNTCGISSESQTICVNPEVIADFTLTPTTGCAPTTVQLDNLSSLPGCDNINVYNWQVTPSNPENCPSAVTPGWSFTTGNATAFEPEITFTSPGIYNVQLTTSLQNAVAGSLCQPDVKSQTVTIKGKPSTTLTPQTICEGTTLTLNPTVFNCYATQAVTYLWDFGSTPPTSISSTTVSNPTVIFGTAGIYNYTLTLTNECGSNVFSSSVTVNPAVQISASGPMATCLNTSIQLTGSISGGTTVGTWTASVMGSFSPNNTALSPTYTPPVNFIGTIVFTLTSADPSGPCPSETTSFSVVFNDQATVDAGNYNSVCQNGTLQLNGVIGGAASSGSWTSSNGGVFSNPNSLTSTFTPSAGFTGTITLTLTTNDPDGPCNSAIDTTTFTVLATPTINSLSDVVICAGGTVGPISFSGTNATNYSWTNNNTAIGLSASGTSAISFTGTNLGNSPISGTITVTPFNTLNGTSCPGTPITFIITINPKGQVNAISNQVVCNGETVTIPDFSTANTGGITTYTWTNNNILIGLATSSTGNIAAFTATNTGPSPVIATITVTPTYTNGSVSCPGTPQTFTITVNATSVGGTAASNQTICNGSSPANITLTSHTGTIQWQWATDLAFTTPNNISGATATPLTSAQMGTLTATRYYRAVVTSGVCPAANSTTVTITVNPTSVGGTAASNQTICSGSSPADITLSGNIGTVQWQSSLNNSTWTNILGATSTTLTTAQMGALTATTYYRAVATSGVCPAANSTTVTITVNPTSVGGTAASNQTICSGSSPTNIILTSHTGTIQWQWATDLAFTTPNNISGATATPLTSAQMGTLTATRYYRAVVTSGVCPAANSTTVTITVNPTSVGGIASSNQTICSGSSPADITLSGNTGTVQWQSSLNNSTWTNISGATSTTLTTAQMGALTATTYYRAVVTSGVCPAANSTTVTITIIAIPSATITGGVSLCQNASSPSITFTGSSGISPYTFTYTINGGTTITITTTTGNSISVSAPTNIVGVYNYNLIGVQESSTATCSRVLNLSQTVIVNALPTITTPLPTQSICVGGSIAALSVLASGGVGTITYQWYSNTSNATTGGTLIASATNANYTPPTFNTVGTYYYYAIATVSGSGCGTVTSSSSQVIVVADPTVSVQPLTSQTQCQGSPATPLTVTAIGGTGTFTYQWYSNAANNNTSGTIISTATSDTYTPLTAVTGTVYYYCVIGQTGLGCNVTSATAAVIVVPAPAITTQPIGSAVCLNGTPTILSVAYSNGTGTPTYQWYSNTTNTTTGGIAVGINLATFAPPSTVVGTLFYYCVVTFSSGGCSLITSDTAQVIINALPTITTPLPTQSICVGGSIAALSVLASGGVGTITYQWYSNTSNATTGGTLIASATNANYTPPTFNTVGTYYYYAIATVSGSGCGTVTSSSSQVIVVADPTVSVQPLTSQTQCQGSPATPLTVTAIGGTGTFTYQWYSNAANNNTSGTIISTATSDTYTPLTAVTGTVYYYCVIGQTGLGCNVTSATAAVIVVPAPAITTQPIGSAVCLNGTPTILSVAYSNGTGTPTYQWYSNTTNTTTGGIAVGINLATFAPPSTVVGTLFYYCVVTFSSGGCSLITSDTAEVIINQIPVVSDQIAIICSTTTFTVAPTNGGSNIVPLGTTYSWPVPVVTGGITGGAVGTSQPTITGILTNQINSETATYTITPTSNGCQGASFTLVVTVNPLPTATIGGTTTVCLNTTPQPIITFVGAEGTAPYTFTYNINGGATQTVTATTGNSVTVNIPTPTAGSFTYNLVSIQDSASPSCSKLQTGSATITVNPLFIASGTTSNYNGYGVSVFGGSDGFIDLTVSGGSGSYTYSWTGPNGFTANTQDLNGVPAGTYTVSINDGYCSPIILTFILTQPPELLIQENLLAHVNLLCFGDSNGTLGVTITQESVSPYDFQLVNASGAIISTIINSPNLNQTFTNLIAGTYSVIITDANGGFKTVTGIIITQPNDIVITFTTTPITCYGANNASITLTVTGGTAPYSAQWSNLASGLYQNNLAAATYSILITDSRGCTKPITVIIPEALVFMVNPIVSNITCFGANNGSINLNLTGGIAPVALVWSDGSTAGLIRNNLVAGTYTATISDGTLPSCVIVRTFIIVEPGLLVLSANITNALHCTNGSSGAINLIVAGGTMPYTYLWSNGSTTEDLTGLTSGSYSVIVTDFRGCVKTAQYSITRPAPILINVTTQTTVDCAAHSINQNFVAQASGGIPPYTYLWSNGIVGAIMNTNVNGTYTVTATDSRPCPFTETVVVNTPVLGYSSFNTTSFGYTTYGIYSIGDPIQFQSTITGDYVSVYWDFGDGTFSTELNPIHTYVIPKDYVVTLTVTYPFGCVYVYTISLIIEKGYLLVVPTAFTPNNDGVNDTFRPVTKALKNIQLDIYDTWGSLIYSEKGDVLRGWDAKIKGFNAENGNYFCKVSAVTFYGTIVTVDNPFTLIK